MIDDKHQHSKAEHDREVRMQLEQINKNRELMRADEEAEQRRKEVFRQEATAHWDEAKKLKANQKEGIK
jgi:hypothetical protein